MRDTVRLEFAGKPTLTLAMPLFVALAKGYGEALGLHDFPLAVIPAEMDALIPDESVHEAAQLLLADLSSEPGDPPGIAQ